MGIEIDEKIAPSHSVPFSYISAKPMPNLWGILKLAGKIC
jgi:hypothetical protein